MRRARRNSGAPPAWTPVAEVPTPAAGSVLRVRHAGRQATEMLEQGRPECEFLDLRPLLVGPSGRRVDPHLVHHVLDGDAEHEGHTPASPGACPAPFDAGGWPRLCSDANG